MNPASDRARTSCTEPWSRGRVLAALGVILLAAATLRVWHLGWGLDRQLAFPDEVAFWKSYLFAFVPPRLASFFGHKLVYPPLYGYLSGLAVSAMHAIGVIGPEQDVYQGLLVARAVSVVASVITVVLVCAVGWRSYGACTGLLAAALMASMPLEAMQTHYVSVDVLLTMTVALILLTTARLGDDRRPWRALLAGASVGLAFGAKYNAAALLAVPMWVVLEDAFATRTLHRPLRLAVAIGVGFVITLAIVSPPWIFETERALGALRSMQRQMTGGWRPDGNHAAASLGWYGRPWLVHVVATLPFAMGWPGYAAALLGIVTAVRRRAIIDRILLLTVVVYFALLGLPIPTFPRYVLPLLPPLVLLAARALVALRLPPRARVALCAAVVAYGFAMVTTQIARFSYDQQFAVAAWLRGLANGGVAPLRVAFPAEMQGYFRLLEPLKQAGFSPARPPVGHWLERSPEAFVLPDWLAINARRDRMDEARVAAVDELESGRAGYREVARWRSTYLQEGFYTWLDPAFAADLYMGEIGFRVYLRDDVATRLGLPAPQGGG
jgi:4-amino-4-deoxy-L-arabinose transferase-like glycosyltransferase